LSIADVASDGPFSRFVGRRRILTVVEGNGMKLIGPNTSLDAKLGVPVQFEGNLEIVSRLKDGPLRDLNLIFDPKLCTGQVTLVKGGERCQFFVGDGVTLAVYCIDGVIELNQTGRLGKGDTATTQTGEFYVSVTEGSLALLVEICRVHQLDPRRSAIAAR